MTVKPGYQPLAATLEQAKQHWRRRSGQILNSNLNLPKAPAMWTIAISRETGAAGEEIARQLGQRLDWPVYDRELVERIARETSSRTELIESLDERPSNWLSECTAAFLQTQTLSSNEYLHQLVETLFSLSAHGECVIVGRGAHALLPQQSTLTIRIVAPKANRIATIAKQRQTSEKAAEQYVNETDRQRHDFIESYFHKDSSAEDGYDLTLSTARFSIDECVELITVALKMRQAHAVENSPAEAHA